MDFPPFPGFREEAFAFLRDLKANNEREWFKPRKQTFDDEVKWPMQCLVVDASRRLHSRAIPLTGDPKKSLFRIYRDTRFSKNKQPYKTHISGVLSRTGGRKEPGGLYLHVEPGNSFLAAGYWRPETPLLRAWRTRMADQPDLFLQLRDQLAAKDLALDARDTLKRLPRGFDAFKEHEIAEYLRWKSHIVTRQFDDAALMTPAFTDEVVQFATDALPLLTYGWDLVDTASPSA